MERIVDRDVLLPTYTQSGCLRTVSIKGEEFYMILYMSVRILNKVRVSQDPGMSIVLCTKDDTAVKRTNRVSIIQKTWVQK
jgi:hypothetical protein